MKIKRFHARTMREALQQVREEQGPDSVILSKQRTAEGIEVIAAVDYDEALLHQSNQTFTARAAATLAAAGAAGSSPASPETAGAPAQEPPADTSGAGRSRSSIGSFFARAYAESAAASADDEEASLDDLPDEAPPSFSGGVEAHAGDSSAPETGAPAAGSSATTDFRSLFDATGTIATLPEPGDSANTARLEEIYARLTTLQQTLDRGFTALHWDDLQRRQPDRADLIHRLELLGLSQPLLQEIVRAIPPHAGQKKAWRSAIGLLAKRIPVTQQDVCEEGGIFAVVGPTGAGKTTSIAKLAARFALEHDPQELGLVTTDGFRIGAQEHLLRFGRILGVPVQVAGTAEILRATLDQLADRKLILIDTAGFSPNDDGMLASLIQLTRHSPTLQTLLTLPANLQTQAIRQSIRTFDQLGLDGAIVTKLDEATSLGGLLSELIASNLNACYVTDGQRVPEDIKTAGRYRAGFVSQAVSLAKTFDDSAGVAETASAPGTGRPSGTLHTFNSEKRMASYG